MDSNNQWQQQMQNQTQPQYGMNNGQSVYSVQSANKKTLSIIALSLGIASVTICCCIGWVPAITSIIIGIIALFKEPKGTLLSVIGIILSVIALIISILGFTLNLTDELNFRRDLSESTGSLIDDMDSLFGESTEEDDTYEYEYKYDTPEYDTDIEDDYSYYDEYEYGDDYSYDGDYGNDYENDYVYTDTYTYTDDNWGYKYTSSDGSVMYCYDNGEFYWFRYDNDYNNLNNGSYTVITGEAARNWLVYEHPEYGVTAQELDDYNARVNPTGELTILILNSESVVKDGQPSDKTPYTTYYFGYSDRNGFDGANLNTLNPFVLYCDEYEF